MASESPTLNRRRWSAVWQIRLRRHHTQQAPRQRHMPRTSKEKRDASRDLHDETPDSSKERARRNLDCLAFSGSGALASF
jgi:hypothetical protein